MSPSSSSRSSAGSSPRSRDINIGPSPSFIEDLKSHADIVQVVQERVALRRSGATWKGLCPFHGEKTPSFHVNGDKGFFHCFGCGAKGDVFEFVKLHDKITFPKPSGRWRHVPACRFPEPDDGQQDPESERDRETLLRAHEVAARWFREQLASAQGAAANTPARQPRADACDDRAAGYGLCTALSRSAENQAPPRGLSRRNLWPEPAWSWNVKAARSSIGFAHRLMIPIARDNGTIIAFGGRAMDAGQVPKYLNSPETPIYVKGRTLYRAPSEQGCHHQVEARRDGRRVFRCRAGDAGRHPQRRRLLGDRADAGASSALETFRVEGRPKF